MSKTRISVQKMDACHATAIAAADHIRRAIEAARSFSEHERANEGDQANIRAEEFLRRVRLAKVCLEECLL